MVFTLLRCYESSKDDLKYTDSWKGYTSAGLYKTFLWVLKNNCASSVFLCNKSLQTEQLKVTIILQCPGIRNLALKRSPSLRTSQSGPAYSTVSSEAQRPLSPIYLRAFSSLWLFTKDSSIWKCLAILSDTEGSPSPLRPTRQHAEPDGPN